MKQRVPIWRKGVRRWPSLRRLVRKHDRILSIIGALIVLSTFLVKEGLLEMAKEWRSSMETGADLYHLQVQVADMAQRIEKVQTQVDISLRRLYGRDSTGINDAYSADRIKADLVRERSLLFGIRSMVHVVEEVPDKERIPIGKKMESLAHQVGMQNQQLSKLSHDNKGSEKLDVIESNLDDLENKATALGDEAIGLGQQFSREYADAQDFLNVIGYLLYAVGWTLTLIGRLYGSGPIAGEI